MKRIDVIAAAISALFFTMAAGAQTPKNVKYEFTEASDLALVGKLFPDTPNPYNRVDTVRFKGFTKTENSQVRMSSGISVAFRTNSTTISVKATYGYKQYASHKGGY